MTYTPQELLAVLEAAWRLAPASTVDVVPRDERSGVVLEYMGPTGRLMRVHVGRWASVIALHARDA